MEKHYHADEGYHVNNMGWILQHNSPLQHSWALLHCSLINNRTLYRRALKYSNRAVKYVL